MRAKIIQFLISATGALLIFQASSFSPDLNPIEFAFHQYKSHLRRNNWRYFGDSYQAHRRALACVTRENMINYYRKVGGIRIPNNAVEVQKNLLLQEEEEFLLFFCLLLLLLIN